MAAKHTCLKTIKASRNMQTASTDYLGSLARNTSRYCRQGYR
jgi:hypothetical protein